LNKLDTLKGVFFIADILPSVTPSPPVHKSIGRSKAISPAPLLKIAELEESPLMIKANKPLQSIANRD
jgi:hypothetical protein